uniref:Signal peptidase complex subunit 3 n=1 Tax=Spongospora subterranea TaxID=70186 RepID=A0A0H5RJT4_9EUKA|eukprot:CRZ08969.1 hypothetical protein [Spongospora subterranea]
MHSVWARANALFFYMLTALAGVAIFCDLSSLIIEKAMPHTNVLDVDIKSLAHTRGHHYSFDEAKLRFSIDCDFSSMFNWNVKQLFVYVQASYISPKKVENRLVLWDQIMPRDSNHKIRLDQQLPEYKLYDILSELGQANMTVSIHCDVMPSVGLLHSRHGHSHVLTLPETSNAHKRSPKGK